jgi:hypothetical protein
MQYNSLNYLGLEGTIHKIFISISTIYIFLLIAPFKESSKISNMFSSTLSRKKALEFLSTIYIPLDCSVQRILQNFELHVQFDKVKKESIEVPLNNKSIAS